MIGLYIPVPFSNSQRFDMMLKQMIQNRAKFKRSPMILYVLGLSWVASLNIANTSPPRMNKPCSASANGNNGPSPVVTKRTADQNPMKHPTLAFPNFAVIGFL